MASKVIYVKKKHQQIYDKAEELCDANDISFSELIVSLLKQYLENKNDKKTNR